MSNRMRMSGINSGMDTQSIVEQLVQAKSTKKEKIKKNQTKLEWKQDAWKTLNAKLYSLYSEQFGTLKMQGSFKTKKASIVDSSIASVTADGSAVNGTQTLAVKQLSRTAYMTGAKLAGATSSTVVGNYFSAEDRNKWFTDGTRAQVQDTDENGEPRVDGEGNPVMVDGDETYQPIKYIVKDASGKPTGKVVAIAYDMTMEQIAEQFSNAGFNASFDSNTNRFFISSKKEGEAGNFTLADENGNDVLNGTDSPVNNTAVNGSNLTVYERSRAVLDALGITAQAAGDGFIKGQNAKIELNNVEYESNTNMFQINGLNITATKESDYTTSVDGEGNEVRKYATTNISTQTDVDGAYNMIKNFLKQYNEIINEMDKLYNEKPNKTYEPLTSEEKDAMSDEEVEEWEKKIKDSLLSRDDNLRTLINTFKEGMAAAYTTSSGKTYSLASFGINTLSYFEAADNEKGAYHIDGDADDEKTKGNDDKLREMLTNNLDDTMDFFNNLAKNIYGKLGDMMARSDYRSFKSLYDDKALKKEYEDLEKDLKDEEQYLSDYEDKWYDKFAAMEKAMEKVNSKSNALAGLFGTGR
jgi:flagellar hook-associated protein 2